MEIYWRDHLEHGFCPTCLASVNPRGFIDFFNDIDVRNENGEIVGVVNLALCATCIEQAARYVGCADRDQVYEMAEREYALMEELEKTRDEVVSERQKIAQELQEILLAKNVSEG